MKQFAAADSYAGSGESERGGRKKEYGNTSKQGEREREKERGERITEAGQLAHPEMAE